MSFLKNKTILITGGTGSFGRNFAKKLLIDDLCEKVIIFSRDEWKQWEMRKNDPIFDHPKIRYFLGDVRDVSRLQIALRDVDHVVHAAALKQVPAAEYNPTEFIKTNVNGAMNLIEASLSCGVKKIIALSTDKAVNPVNMYGATKLCSDKLFVSANAYRGAHDHPIFSVVRYGNVLASRGSIIPFWKELIRKGAEAFPITDPEMTRFWISLDQSVQFVLQCLEGARGGEIYVPKVPSMKITDLAKAIAPDLPHKIVGIRPGEKLHELLISGEDARHTLEYKNHYMIVPELFAPISENEFIKGRKGQSLPTNFFYASNTNSDWMNVEDIKKVLKQTK